MLSKSFQKFFKKQYLLVTYNNDALVLTAADVQWRKIHPTATETKSFKNFEVVNNRIINATKVNDMIATFAAAHCTVQPKLITFMPPQPEDCSPFTILQSALIISKKLPIQHLIEESCFNIGPHIRAQHHRNDSCPSLSSIHQAPHALDALKTSTTSILNFSLMGSLTLLIIIMGFIVYTYRT